MDRRTNERTSVASSEDSLVLYLNGGPPPKRGWKKAKQRRRACPVLAFLGLIVHFLAASCGVVISVLVVKFNLEVTSAGIHDIIARILVFVASCMGIFYVLMHAFAARENYVRSHGSPQLYGYFTVGITVLVMRLKAPVWIASIVMTSLVAVKNGFDVKKGIKGNAIWVQLGIASLGLISLLILVIITERTDRPFATLLFSKQSFINGINEKRKGRTDTFDMSVSRQGIRLDDDEYDEKTVSQGKKGPSKYSEPRSVFDRSVIATPTSPFHSELSEAVPDWPRRMQSFERARSQTVPSPLASVYGPLAGNLPAGAQESDMSGAHFSWRPPTRDSTYTQNNNPPESNFSWRPATRDSMYSQHNPPESQFSWQPPTRDSTYSQHNPPESYFSGRPPTRDSIYSQNNPQGRDNYNAHWPPSAPETPRTNRVSAPPPSQPPNIPLPLLIPPPYEGTNLAEKAYLAKTAQSEPSTSPDSAVPDTQQSTSTASDEQPIPPTNAHKRRPTLPSLEGLSARAAARHRRNSLLVRAADLNPRQSVVFPTDTAKVQPPPQPAADEMVEIPRPEITPREFQREESTEDDEEEDDVYEGREQRGGSPPRWRRSQLSRSNTAGPRLVRNFSRPRVPSGVLRRRPSEGNIVSTMRNYDDDEDDDYDDDDDDDDDDDGEYVRGRTGNRSRNSIVRERKQQIRRSRSLPSSMRDSSRMRESIRDGSRTRERVRFADMDFIMEPIPAPTVVNPPPPPPRKSSKREKTGAATGTRGTAPTAAPVAAAAAPAPVPRYSPFPTTVTVPIMGPVPVREKKGKEKDKEVPLGRSWSKRLEKKQPQQEQQQQQQQQQEQQVSLQNSASRGKLSREKSLAERARRAAQNF